MNLTRSIAIIAVASYGVTAFADVEITQHPGNFQGDQNVLFNMQGGLDNGPLVQGQLNQSHDVVDFSQAGETLITPSNGQARVEAADGSLRELSVNFHEPGKNFDTLIWNLDAVAVGTVTFTIERTGGQAIVRSFSLDRNGQNFFRFQSVGESMSRVHLSTDVDLNNVKQTRMGPAGPVPEPASIAVIGMGVAALLRRRRK